MASRHDYQESLGESSTTSSSFTTKVSSSTTLTSGVTYVLIWSCQVLLTNTSNASVSARLRDATGAATLQNYSVNEAKDATDYVWTSGTAVFTAASTATNEFRIEFARGTNGTGRIKNARLLILALGSGEFSSASTGNSSTSSGTFQDKISLSVNGAETEDYLVLGSLTTSNMTGVMEARGLKADGSTAVNTTTGLMGNISGNEMYNVQWPEALTGANVNVKLQYRSTSGGSVTVQSASIAAIRKSTFGDYTSTFDDADDGGTDTVATDSETVQGDGVDTVGGEVIVIANVTYRGSSTSVSSQVDVREGSTTIIESLHEPRGATAKNAVSGVVGFVSSSANDPETWKIRRLSETSSTTTTINFAAITVLGLSTGSVYDESISGAISAGMTLAQIATVVGAVTGGAVLAQAAARDMILGPTVSEGLVLAKTLATDATMDSAITVGLVLNKLLSPELVLELAKSAGLVLDKIIVPGTTFEASIEDELVLDQAAASTMEFFEAISAALELDATKVAGTVVEAALSMALSLDKSLAIGGDYNVSVEILLFLDKVAAPELTLSAETIDEVGLGIVLVPGTTFEAEVDAGLVLEELLATQQDQGANVSAGLTLAQAAVGNMDMTVAVAAGLTLDQASARSLVMQAAASAGLSMNKALAIGGTYNVGLTESIILNAPLTPNLVMSRSMSQQLTLAMHAEIIDFDFLFTISENFFLGLNFSFENWFTQQQSGSTTYTAKEGSAATFTAKTGPATQYNLVDNYEDPEYTENNP